VSGARPLIDVVQALLERTYAMPRGLVRADRFVIGDLGLRALYGGSDAVAAGAHDGQGARTLVRETADGVRVCVYFPDAMIRRLEERPPTRGVRPDNVDAFATLVEEIDHLLVLAERVADGRCVSLFELELHANVSKWLVLGRFLAGRERALDRSRRAWLRWNLFFKQDWVDDEIGVRNRYRDAARYAVGFLDALARQRSAERRLDLIRRFHVAPLAEKLRLGAVA